MRQNTDNEPDHLVLNDDTHANIPFAFDHDPFLGYLSDQTEEDIDEELLAQHPPANYGVIPPPPRKRQRLAVPARDLLRQRREEHHNKLKNGLEAIEKLIISKKTVFAGGQNGLQAYRTRAIQSCLHMMVKNGRHLIIASKIASEGHGFSATHGSKLLRSWVRAWLDHRELPVSRHGCHSKVFSLLDDPEICTELRAFLRMNKWSMNPNKLANFSKDTLLPLEIKKHQGSSDNDMPQALKKYLEVQLFPRIQMKVKKGISIQTARRWLHKEGFRYSAHKKALYYDGHEREDVVEYRQTKFIPQMREYERRLVKFEVGNVTKELDVASSLEQNERPLVLVAQDEMTAQCNDGRDWSWVWKGEQPLKKKGAGRGLHQSDVIASTVGWLKEASQTLEYGKNYEGYWTGELFVKQVC